MKNKSHVLLRIIVIAAMLVLVVAAAIECANGKSLSETAWSLLPPVIAIVLALISKEAYSSLFIGVVVGALFTTNFAPVAALDAVVNDGLIAAIADNAGIFLFLGPCPAGHHRRAGKRSGRLGCLWPLGRGAHQDPRRRTICHVRPWHSHLHRRLF